MDTISLKNLLLHWYGKPLSPQEAQQLADLARQRLEKRARSGKTEFCTIMLQTIADWWLDETNSVCLSRGMHYATTQRKMALYHLIAGQLLMSCKMTMALDYLDMGLRHADGLISAEAYFSLYNRHEELRFLTLYTTRQQAHDLPALLNASRVMRKLAPHRLYSIHHNKTIQG